MDDKDIIIKLLEKADDTSEAQSMHEFYGHIADYLLANGIAVVKHGRWLFDGDCLICSQCNAAYGFSGSNYCPNCGAKMDGGIAYA